MEANETKKLAGFDKYELESCVDCLIRAEEIKSDEKKMKALKPFLEKKMKGFKKTIDSLEDLKGYVKDKQEKELEDEDEY